MGRVSKMIQKERVLGSCKHYQKHKHITTISNTTNNSNGQILGFTCVILLEGKTCFRISL